MGGIKLDVQIFERFLELSNNSTVDIYSVLIIPTFSLKLTEHLF